MAAHTSGPWKANEEAAGDASVFVGSNLGDTDETKNGGMWVARCLGPDRKANARLIAAAPDLLAILQQIIETVDFERGASKEDGPEAEQLLIDARAAIAKAITP